MLNQNIKKITAISMLAFTIGISGASASTADLSEEAKAYGEKLAEKTYSPEKAGLEPAIREAKEEKFYLEWFESLSIEDKEKVVEILKEKLPKSNPVSVGDTSNQKPIKFSRAWRDSLSTEEMKAIEGEHIDFTYFTAVLLDKYQAKDRATEHSKEWERLRLSIEKQEQFLTKFAVQKLAEVDMKTEMHKMETIANSKS